ncbi:hypothetical protein [Acidisphaera sp. S103]|uniref:hypothetical protein n=1 Tax=Acidisphaera sp. S103 TaxID=1747223 RepID=UPI00131CABB2|nr:hypothetical protein [Acidisphaera sp. S103]
MRSHENTLFLMAATIVVVVSTIIQTTPNTPMTVLQPHADGDGSSTIWPASDAYKKFSDPKGWDADAKAWYKQHTQGTSKLSERAKAIDPGLLLAGPCHSQRIGREAAIMSADQKGGADEGSTKGSAARRCLHPT